MENNIPMDNQNMPKQTSVPPQSPQNKSKFSPIVLIIVGIIGIILVSLVITFALLERKSTAEKSLQNVSPTLTNKNESTKTYSDSHISFQYPSLWHQDTQKQTGSGYIQAFTSQGDTFTLTITMRGNYNNQTGKQFANLEEYLNLGNLPVENLTIDGQVAIQTLPRAGSENVTEVTFFSKDSQFIYDLILENDKSHPEKFDERQTLYRQILASIKFSNVGQLNNWKTYKNTTYNFLMKYPPTFRPVQTDSTSSEPTFYATNTSQYPQVGLHISKGDWEITSSYQTTTFLGMPARKTSWNSAQNAYAGEALEFLYQGNDYYFSMQYYDAGVIKNIQNKFPHDSTVTQDNSAAVNTFNQILATFNFTTPTAPIPGWKTYSDTKEKFSIQYPSEWNIFPNIVGGVVPGLNGTVINSASQLEPHGEMLADTGQAGISINVVTTNKPENETLLDYQNKDESFSDLNGARSETQVNGLDAIKYVKSSDPSSESEIYVLSSGSWVYQINVSVKNPNYSKTIDQILSTFTFAF